MTHHLFLARNTSFLLFSEELLPDTRLSQQQTGGVQLHIEDWLAGVQRSSRQKKPLKTILGTSTLVESPLQIVSFMQNEPNFLETQINVTSFYTKDYENKRLADAAKTNPIQTQYKANTKPIQTQSKPLQSQNKPNQPQFLKIPHHF